MGRAILLCVSLLLGTKCDYAIYSECCLSTALSLVASSCLAPPVALKAGKGNDEPLCADPESSWPPAEPSSIFSAYACDLCHSYGSRSTRIRLATLEFWFIHYSPALGSSVISSIPSIQFGLCTCFAVALQGCVIFSRGPAQTSSHLLRLRYAHVSLLCCRVA